MKIIIHVGSESAANLLQERLDASYCVHHVHSDMALVSELGAHYEKDPDMVVCEVGSLGSVLQDPIELIEFLREGYPDLPVILIDNNRSGTAMGLVTNNAWLIISNEVDTLIKYIHEVFATKH